MIDFLLSQLDIWFVIGAIGILVILWFIQLHFDDIGNFVWFIRVTMAVVVLYLLGMGGVWLVTRFLGPMESYP